MLSAGLTAMVLAAIARAGARTLVTVPMGPAMIAGAVLALWV